jgi:Flagellar capping protein
MGTIQTTVGLITGINIQELVDKLMEISARPKTMLEERNKTLQEQQTALGTLAGLLYAIKMPVATLAKTDTYQQRQVTSSHSDILGRHQNRHPALGQYELTPIH